MDIENDKTYAYVLVDPRTIKIRYIGITKQFLVDRLQNHIDDARHRPEFNWHKANWIRELLKINSRPLIRKIAEFDNRTQAQEFESILIKKYITSHKLVNVSLEDGRFTRDGQKTAAKVNAKIVYVYNYDGSFYKEFPSILKCSEALNIYHSTIARCLKGQYKYAKSYQFSFTKEKQLQDLTNYSTGSSRQVQVRDNLTGGILTFKSIVACKQYFQLEFVSTSKKYLLGALNKKYGNQYSVWNGTTWEQSMYYNTGVIIKCKDCEYKFESKLKIIEYLGYKTKAMLPNVLDRLIRKNFQNIIEIRYNLPIIEVTQ